MPTIEQLGRLVLALVLGVAVGWEPSRELRRHGMRTYPIVAVGACGWVLIAADVFGAASDGTARVLQGLLTGIGFVGAGAILKGKAEIHGLAAAASVWNTGAIGASLALGRYGLAVALTLVTVLFLLIHPRP